MNVTVEKVLGELKNLNNKELLEIEKNIHFLYNKNKKMKDIRTLSTFQCMGKIRDFSRQDTYINRI